MDNERYPAAAGQGGLVGANGAQMHNPTIRENIDNQIKALSRQIIALQQTRAQLEEASMLDMRIHDLQSAMRVVF